MKFDKKTKGYFKSASTITFETRGRPQQTGINDQYARERQRYCEGACRGACRSAGRVDQNPMMNVRLDEIPVKYLIKDFTNHEMIFRKWGQDPYWPAMIRSIRLGKSDYISVFFFSLPTNLAAPGQKITNLKNVLKIKNFNATTYYNHLRTVREYSKLLQDFVEAVQSTETHFDLRLMQQHKIYVIVFHAILVCLGLAHPMGGQRLSFSVALLR